MTLHVWPVVVTLFLCLWSANATAQETPLHKRVTVDWHDVKLADALKELGGKVGVRVVAPESLAEQASRVTYAATQQEAGRVIGQVLRARGLRLGQLQAGQATVERLTALDALAFAPTPRCEFAEKPTAVRNGDAMTIRFAVKEFCDATVAIEDARGTILRYLASGVLGENAPPPFLWNTRRQELVWDCKDEKGAYVENKDLVVRVSLGLAPRFERTLYWSPHKLGQNGEQVTLCPAPEGVYVYNVGLGRACQTPSLRLFDRDGGYARTLYPFPTSQLDNVQGLTWNAYPPDGRKFPLKGPPLAQTSLLPWPGVGIEGPMRDSDVRNLLVQDKDYLYLVGRRLLRIAKAGSGKSSLLEGPDLSMNVTLPFKIRPTPGNATLSPDGKWLYMTGYSAFFGLYDEGHAWQHFMPCITRMPSDGSRGPELFVGKATIEPPADSILSYPNDLAFDRDGRIIVADIIKGLIVLSPEGTLLDQIKADCPGRVQIDPATGELWTTSWILGGYGGPQFKETPAEIQKNIVLSRWSPYKPGNLPKVIQKFVLGPDVREFKKNGYSVAIDFSGKTPRVWLGGAADPWAKGRAWENLNIRVFDIRADKPEEVFSFEKATRQAVTQSRPPRYGRQRPYANPADGCVYIAEQIQPTVVSDVQCFDQLVRIDPATGACSMVDLPFDTEDMAFDPAGLAYFRTDSILARYDPTSWREVPFDYGMELENVTHYGLKPTKVISTPYFRGGRGASGKIFGMGVNARGDVAVSFYSTDVSSVEMASEGSPDIKRPNVTVDAKNVKPWTPQVYPGRSTFAFIHIWDKYGKLRFEDAVRGLGEMSDVKIDRDNNLYMIANMVLPDYLRVHPDRFINTLLKVPAGKGRFVTDGSAAPVRLAEANRPARPPDAIGIEGYRGNVWLDGVEWALGGVGGNGRGLAAMACHCEANSSIALDYFARAFVPVLHRYEVLVVDSAGNTITRIGRYGNVDDGKPLIASGGPADTRSIGGDEVALVSPKWMAVLTDRRLFVSDRGNYRQLCIKLGYRAEERVTPQ